ncbi:hypothetical protein KR054_010781 [Drosophila jambulina]|nr:hypothetical protein KR054_010781 [Drosophila jambulina]
MVREQERDKEQLHPTREKPRHRTQRIKRSMMRRQLAQFNWDQAFEDQEQQQEESQASIALPSCYYSAPAGHQRQQKEAAPVSQRQLQRGSDAAPATFTLYGAPRATPAAAAPNADVSQSVFELTCLPSAALGTKDPPPSMDTSSIHQLPSSISCASLISHTLSSLPPVEENRLDSRPEQSIISPDLFFNRSLLDMDREDTQEEDDEQGSPYDQWEWQINSNRRAESPRHPIDIDAVPAAREPLFRSPSSHGEDYPEPDLNCVPANIRKLHKTITQRYSDYAFVYTLCAQLGQECVPMDCYVYLKMILFASIVSIEPDELRPPISVCIIATDSLMAHRVMNCIGQLAPRFLGPHEYGLQPAIAGGQLSSSRYTWVVASPLLLAQQGVYYAGDWSRLSKEHSEQIEKCLENGCVPVPQLQSDQALEAAVWTHWQPENSINQTLAFAKLCPTFGMPIYMGIAAGSNTDSLWNFMLRQQTEEESDDEQPDCLNIPEDDIRMLLHLLHQREVTFQDDAQHMLHKYYMISRKERPTVFTSKTYVVLKQFAESFAKLALRLEVMESDVCVAIFHCEHFVQQFFGRTSPPPPVLNTFNVISHIDPYMNEFGRWLLQFLDRYKDKELGLDKAKRRRTDSWDFP